MTALAQKVCKPLWVPTLELISHIDFESILFKAQNTIGTFMQGHSIYEENSNSGILVWVTKLMEFQKM